MTPNQITLSRVGLALVAVFLFELGPMTGLLAVLLTLFVVFMDAVDGYVARRQHMTSTLGATMDILGDRMVENIFLIYFASAGVIPFWIPIVVIVRGMATDFIRSLASQQGKSAFGKHSMMETWWGKALVGSRTSRAAYGCVKCLAFAGLGLTLSAGALSLGAPEFMAWVPSLRYVALGSAYLVVSFCVIRGWPVLWEGRRVLGAYAQT